MSKLAAILSVVRPRLLGGAIMAAALFVSVPFAAFADLVHSYDLESDGTDGTGSLDLTVTGSPIFEAACDGNGVHLDGIAQYLRSTSNPWGATPSGFTDSIWAAVDALPASGDNLYVVYSNDESYRISYAIFLRNNSGTEEVHFRVFDTSQNGHDAVATYTTPTDGTFTHFAVTWDGSDLVGYINGSAAATLTFPGVDANDNGTQYEIGGAGGAGQLLSGIFDSGLVYDSALSSGAISDLYTAGCSYTPPDDGGGDGGGSGTASSTFTTSEFDSLFVNSLILYAVVFAGVVYLWIKLA